MRDIDTIRLPSGRTFYANRGIVGINADCDEISEGYDGEVVVDERDADPWTALEKIELADMMIARWTKFRDAAS